MYQSMDQQLQALKRLTTGIFAAAVALLLLTQNAQAQCPQTLDAIQWASSNPSNPLTVSKLLNQGNMTCNTPIYFGLHRGGYTRAMDLDSHNQPVYPSLGQGQSSVQALAGPTTVTSSGTTYPLYPQSIASVAVPAYQTNLAQNSNHLPSSVDSSGMLTFNNAVYSAWPAIVELDPRRDSSGTWYLFHGVYTNSDALTPGVDPNDLSQAQLPTSQATLANDQLLYRATPLASGYVASGSAPSIDQLATAQQILDAIMTDPSVNMVLQLHTRSYDDTLAFYTWLLQTWAPGHTTAQMVNAIGRIYFCVDLNKMTPQGQGSNSNDYNNLSYLSSWNTAVAGIRAATANEFPNVPIDSFPPVALMVNFYDDTNLYTPAPDADVNVITASDVSKAFAIIQSAQQQNTYAKYLGIEITDEDSVINSQLQSLGQMVKSQLGLHIGKSVLTGDHFISVTDTNNNAAVRYGAVSAATPVTLTTGNNSVVNGTSYRDLWNSNQANLVDLNYSLSFQLGVQDTTSGPMGTYDPNDNNTTSLTQVQPTIVLSDLPLIHGAKQNGEVRSVFQGSYTTPTCAAGAPGCSDATAPGDTTYTFCASQGNVCGFTGDRNVAYGANGNYVYQTVTTGLIACVASNFPNPPSGSNNSCYYSPPIGYAIPSASGIYNYGLIYCADEGGICNHDEGSDPAWMAGGGGYTRTYLSLSSPWDCNRSTTFSATTRPFPNNITNACFYYIDQGYVNKHNGPTGYQWCGGEGRNCNFKGLGRVAYGYSGDSGGFTYKVANGGIGCNNDAFGVDPYPGQTKDCYYQVTTAANGSTGTYLGSSTSGDGSASVCDIYANGGTPCVAAHSIVRALFGNYSGNLYQVKRASDSSTANIGLLNTGGYVNAAAQDSFCSGTTCIVTVIYDQTANHNDLQIEGPGGNGPQDYGATANALPVKIDGNEAYGLSLGGGVGYRNNSTKGVARGVSPEGMYMVTSGSYFNSACCFDYGNAETSGDDTGNGHMDALNFSTYCEFGPCNGSGPWVEADLENGQYMGNGSNTGDLSLSYPFVTAMLKNNGTNTFALKGGNSQSGGITTMYSGSLPTVKSGYKPMSLEGAIVLGTGGDNSNNGVGAFFEGAMTSGYPTDATESAVQANIVAAGYSGDSYPSFPNSGTTYTGPSDPNGPGPQDGFETPADLQANDLMGSKPGMAYFNGRIYAGFQSNDARNELYVTSTTIGTPYPVATSYPSITMGSAPALAEFNHQLFVAFKSNDSRNEFFITSSQTGTDFPTATGYSNILMGSAPALAVFNHQLMLAFQANDAGHTLHVSASIDGATWPNASQIANVAVGSAPAMTVFNHVLYIAFRANDSSNSVWIASSIDGKTFTSKQLTGQTMGPNSSPALVVSGGVLYCIYGANDTASEMLVTSSYDGSTWQGPAAFLNVRMGASGPAATAYTGGLTVGFQSNDPRNVLFTSFKATEAAGYTGPNDPNGSGPQDLFPASATLQAVDLMGTKPAFAAVNNNYVYVAFGSNDPRNILFVSSTSLGATYPAATPSNNIVMGSAPAMTSYHNQLYVAFQSNDARNLLFTTSSTGTSFPAATPSNSVEIGGAPALATFNNKLYVAFQSNDARNLLFTSSLTSGTTFPTATPSNGVQMGSAPAMTAFNGKLYVAFKALNPGNAVIVASSTDGVNFTTQALPNQYMNGDSSPALVTDGCALYLIYQGNDAQNELLVTSSADGSTWQGPKAYYGVQMNADGPGAAFFNGGITAGFQADDPRNVLFTVYGKTTSSGCIAQ